MMRFWRPSTRIPAALPEDKEFDPYTGRRVRKGWVAERQAIMDAEYELWLSGERNGGTCLACHLPTNDHPMPDRLWRSGPDLCAAARAKQGPK